MLLKHLLLALTVVAVVGNYFTNLAKKGNTFSLLLPLLFEYFTTSFCIGGGVC